MYLRSFSFSLMLTVVNSPKLSSLATSMASLTTHLPVLSTNTPRNSSSTASVAPTTIYSTISSTTTETNTWKLAPTSTSIAQGSQLLSTPAIESSRFCVRTNLVRMGELVKRRPVAVPKNLLVFIVKFTLVSRTLQWTNLCW